MNAPVRNSPRRIPVVAVALAFLLSWEARSQIVITQFPPSPIPLASAVLLSIDNLPVNAAGIQWRLNGVDIPNATNALFQILNLRLVDSGNYSVVVTDSNGMALDSGAVALTALGLPLPFADNFDARGRLIGLFGAGVGNNSTGTREPGEPLHAAQNGTNSVWLTWTAPANGIATFTTAGSGFDAMIAAYVGGTLTNLVAVAGDDDAGGFLTGVVKFNAVANTDYQIAIDGRAGAAGNVVLSWNLEITDDTLPVVVGQSQNQAAAPGVDLDLFVSFMNDPSPEVQWLFNDKPIEGGIASSVIITNLAPEDVGRYVLRIRSMNNSFPREVLSRVVDVQINMIDGRAESGTLAHDKFADVAEAAAPPAVSKSLSKSRKVKKAGGPATGFTGTQIFSTFGSTKEPGEPDHCGVAGGASEWYAYVPPASGRLNVNTDGSTFDTVLAIYTGPGTDFASLVEVSCDNDSGVDGRDSSTTFPVDEGTLYFIAVDGVNAANGTVHLNYNLDTAPTLTSVSNQSTDEDIPTPPVVFLIGDRETLAENLTLSASCSNTNLIPDENIMFGGAGSNRTVVLTPASDRNGSAVVILSVEDLAGNRSSRTFTVTVNPVNDRPTLSVISDCETDEDTSIVGIPFTVGDVETDAVNLILSVNSSDPDLVPLTSIVINGSGTNHTLTITPAPDRNGAATITVTVSDADGATTNASFILTVNPVNDPPGISAIPDQSTTDGTPTEAVLFNVDDLETDAGDLILTGSSSNPALVPDSNVSFSGVGNSRYVFVTPVAGQTGSAIITVCVTDGNDGTASSSFVLTVNAAGPLQFVSTTMLSDGTVKLAVAGGSLLDVVVQATADFSTWTPVFTNTIPSASIEFIDPGATNHSARFYRAVR